MYDEKKLNDYWERHEKIRANWRRNGWDGKPETAFGRDIKYDCGHEFFAGWGIPQLGLCYDCKFKRKLKP